MHLNYHITFLMRCVNSLWPKGMVDYGRHYFRYFLLPGDMKPLPDRMMINNNLLMPWYVNLLQPSYIIWRHRTDKILVIIGSGKGLSPVRLKALTWINTNFLWIKSSETNIWINIQSFDSWKWIWNIFNVMGPISVSKPSFRVYGFPW